ncbi:MAG: HlyD family efflux transporter periplasmic adaptor subunit [Chitinophagaceae bacterium]|nr:HlyD family efflux transporter periplasmic adaptor subunit [Chitinophagaceae bacterium]
MKPWLLSVLFTGPLLYSCHKAPQVHLQQKDIIETVYASGKIVSEDEYSLYALSNGAILKKTVKDGDMVRRGQVLYIVQNEAVTAKYQAALDNYQNTELNLSGSSPLLRDLQLSLQNMEIRLKNDSLTYHRWKTLWEQGIGTRSNLDNAYTSYQISVNQQKSAAEKYYSTLHDLQVTHSNARSQVQAARKELSDYFIMADRDGVVWQTYKEAGEGLRANEVVALIGDSSRRIIRLAVDQEDISRIKRGQRVVLKTDLSGDTVYEARITHIYPAMNESDQTFRVDAVFQGKMPPVYIHSSVEANIIVAAKPGANVLLREALASDDSVWVLEKGKEKKVAVTTGLSTLDYVEILDGINAKTLVLLKSKNGVP